MCFHVSMMCALEWNMHTVMFPHNIAILLATVDCGFGDAVRAAYGSNCTVMQDSAVVVLQW